MKQGKDSNKAYILKSDGTRVDLDHRPTLEESQKIVGGYIEFAHPRPPTGITIVVDEDGLMKHRPMNVKATELYGNISPIVGDIIVLEGWKTVG
jgi:hypothetical protein